MVVHVHDPGESADDEVDPGVALQAQGQGRHARRLQDPLLPVRAAGGTIPPWYSKPASTLTSCLSMVMGGAPVAGGDE